MFVKLKILETINRQHAKNGTNNWSLAVLVRTRNLMMEVSDYLSTEQIIAAKKLPAIHHDVSLETSGPALSAALIAKLLGKEGDVHVMIDNFIIDLCNHMKGRKGNEAPAQKVIELTEALEKYKKTKTIRGKNRTLIIDEINNICKLCINLELIGEPATDWIKIRDLLQSSKSNEIVQVGMDAKYLRLLRKGTLLNAGLNELWRNNKNYFGASELIKNALLQEHFSTSILPWRGIYLMTMHAAKGKEFTEVIIYDGPNKYKDRILTINATEKDITQARITLRVAVTRAMEMTTILSPEYDPCALL